MSQTGVVETDKRDRYGREVGKVLVDGVDANQEQIRRGMAWHFKAYEREQPAADVLPIQMLKMQQGPLDGVYGQTQIQCHLGTFGRLQEVTKHSVELPATVDGAFNGWAGGSKPATTRRRKISASDTLKLCALIPLWLCAW